MADIEFLPVCSNCGQIIYEIIDIEYSNNEIDDCRPNKNKYLFKESYITPFMCPYCNRQFTGIIIPSKLPFDNRKLFTMEIKKQVKGEM